MRCKPWIPKSPKIFGVGEAPGETEDRIGLPFMGSSGQLLDQMLLDAGIPRSYIALSNVFMDRPEGNKWEEYTCTSVEAWNQAQALGLGKYNLPPIAQGKYLQPHRFWELLRLRQELTQVRPNLAIALGNVALWALCGVTGIKKYRGAIIESTLVPGLKVLPTIHPAAVMREWDMRTVVTADLIKARNESEFPEIIYPEREIWIAPTLDDIRYFKKEYLDGKPITSTDIETIGPFISCVGFATSKDRALVIPFVYPETGASYWSPQDEVEAYFLTKQIIEEAISLLMQNGLFDTQYFLLYQMLPYFYNRDTMFKYHAMYPGLPKSLGFIGSIHCNERAWKTLRPRQRVKLAETEKDED